MPLRTRLTRRCGSTESDGDFVDQRAVVDAYGLNDPGQARRLPSAGEPHMSNAGVIDVGAAAVRHQVRRGPPRHPGIECLSSVGATAQCRRLVESIAQTTACHEGWV